MHSYALASDDFNANEARSKAGFEYIECVNTATMLLNISVL